MHSCHLILDLPADGAWNMALDEALLEAAKTDGVATLRFYTWQEPTLSLGYFQRAHRSVVTCGQYELSLRSVRAAGVRLFTMAS